MKKTLLPLLLAAVLLSSTSAAQAQPSPDVPDLTPYILTPPTPPTPRINGPKVFGARPNAQFLFSVPVSGDRPMTFEADGLPKGLRIDTATGQITGRVEKAGTYRVTVSAKNKLGVDSRELRIVIGDRIALTPPMGWNSWNCWARDVTQQQVLSSARAMVESGLVNHGWAYINIDDGWQGKRGGKYNAIQPNQKFPDMKALTDEVHAMGLKLGIYSSPWIGTYAAHIGSYADNPDGVNQWIKDGNHNDNFRYEKKDGDYWKDRKEVYHHGPYSFVQADAKQWADWKIDYLKYDWNPNDVYHVKEMHDALRATDRDIVYSLSNTAPFADAPAWVQYADCWRTTGDIRDTWKSISTIGFEQHKWAPFCGPGHWPDADMLVVGLVGWGPKLHYTKLSADEQYTHMSLWAMLASPLLIGCDLARIDPFTKSLLSNDEVIAVNQDPLGIHAVPIWQQGEQVIFVKHLEDGAMAVGLFNKALDTAQISFKLKQLGISGTQTIRDIWRQKDIAQTNDTFSADVPPHGVILLKVYPGNPNSNKQK